MTTATYYSDITTNFDIHPIKEDLVLLTNEQAVKRSIRNLLLTDPGERFFRPNLGGGIRATLFENISRDTEFLIKEKIVETIKNYEPRASLYSVNVKALPDDNSYSATIIFYVTNNSTPITLDLILRRVR
jgi:phage baseplate assembly protein W